MPSTDVNSEFSEVTNNDVSTEEQNEVAEITDIFHTFKRYRKRFDEKWMDYYRLLRGIHWDSKRPAWKNSEVVNLIWQTIQSQIPLQTDVRPRFSFLPQEPQDRFVADILDSVADSEFEKFNWIRTVFEVLFDGWIYGTGYASVNYDPSLEYGAGASVFLSEDPHHCYPDPDANEINDTKSEIFFYAKPIATHKLKRKYPDKADKIKPDIMDRIKKDKTETRNFKITYYNSDRDLPEGTFGNQDQNTTDDVPRTFVIHAFMKPNDVVEEHTQDVDDNGSPIDKFTLSKAHPNGRHVVIANGMILEDGDLTYEDNLFPFAKYNNYILPREFYGVSEAEQLSSPQIVFNKILSFSLDSLAMAGNPIWIVDTTSEIDTDNLNNVPGAVIEKAPGSEVRRESGVGINQTAFQLIDRLENWFNTVAGNSEFSEGGAPGGVTAASAIEQLIRASKTRIRQKQRNLDTFMKDAGRLYLNRILEFYTAPQIFRMTGQDGEEFFRRFRVDNIVDEKGKKQKKVVFSDFNKNEKNEMTEGDEQSVIISGNFDLRVKTGSELPFEVADLERKSLALFDRGVIDAEEVLTRIDYPNKEKVLQRLADNQQAAANAAPPPK